MAEHCEYSNHLDEKKYISPSCCRTGQIEAFEKAFSEQDDINMKNNFSKTCDLFVGKTETKN